MPRVELSGPLDSKSHNARPPSHVAGPGGDGAATGTVESTLERGQPPDHSMRILRILKICNIHEYLRILKLAMDNLLFFAPLFSGTTKPN